MKTLSINALLALSLCGFCASHASQAATYTFTQTFSEGAVLSGSFTAVDLDNNGEIVFGFEDDDLGFGGVPNEVFSFFASFSGNSLVPALTFGLVGLDVLLFDLNGSPVLGDSSEPLTPAQPFTEGFIAFSDQTVDDGSGYRFPFEYLVGDQLVGPCDGLGPCATLGSPAFFGPPDFTTVLGQTSNQLLVTEVTAPIPLPAGGFLLVAALGAVAAAARRRV